MTLPCERCQSAPADATEPHRALSCWCGTLALCVPCADAVTRAAPSRRRGTCDACGPAPRPRREDDETAHYRRVP